MAEVNTSGGTGHATDVEDVRKILAADDYKATREIIDRAERALEDVKRLMLHTPLARDGSLVSGTIEYAAFRIETLSLIFEVAEQTFRKFATKEPEAAYQRFLSDLGNEVGLTFGRDLMNRLSQRGLLFSFHDLPKLLKLWVSLENDAGAGETEITQYSPQQITVCLTRNPLRRVETSPHAHCGFYKSYLSSLVNEIFKVRARYLQTKIQGADVRAQSVLRVVEQTQIQDQCVFIVECRPERLTRAFDLLTEAYNQFYRLNDDDDHAECMIKVRGALLTAQMSAIGLTEERPPKGLHEIYKGTVSRDLFKLMDTSYQRVSKALHSEARSSAKMPRKQAWSLLLDVRTCVYSLEALDLDDTKKEALQAQVRKLERLAQIEDLAEKATALEVSEKQELRRMVAEIRGGRALTEDRQRTLVASVKKIGGKAWEVFRPVISDVLTAAIKNELGLE